ncbi:pentapeptide repeat-containing protein [Streptomyces sp. NPDC014676]|uniref:pentapeptide repeat-containing protein n=1 Tax=Streptomyces sp. NPDC014676 TaxID=3364879 RepID=UPI0036F8B0BA
MLVLSFTTAVLVAAAVFYTGWDLLGARGLKLEHRVDSKTLFDLVKLSFGVVAGAGALVALVVAYRRQRVDEDGALREATRLHTERFTTAVSQLGEESAAVRLGGVHALAGLADDAPTRALRQTCIDVLCSYLRLPYTAEADLPAGDAGARHAYLALREVRHTVVRLLRNHLRLAPEHPHSWQGHDLDLTNVTFDGGDFSGAVFVGGTVSFGGATFADGTLSFNKAVFAGGTASFDRATFAGGTVSFGGATFADGTVSFNWAEFAGGTASFDRATFASGTVSFNWAEFAGGTVLFSAAEFSGSTVDFRKAVFADGMVNFGGATFAGGTVDFSGAAFCGSTVSFVTAEFSGGTVDFGSWAINQFIAFRTDFSGGTVDFSGAEFAGGTVNFDGATFSGGTVDFSGADGTAPSGLIPPTGSPLPTGLLLPSAWPI